MLRSRSGPSSPHSKRWIRQSPTFLAVHVEVAVCLAKQPGNLDFHARPADIVERGIDPLNGKLSVRSDADLADHSRIRSRRSLMVAEYLCLASDERKLFSNHSCHFGMALENRDSTSFKTRSLICRRSRAK